MNEAMIVKPRLLLLQARLTNYTVNAVTQGPESLAVTRVSVSQKRRDSPALIKSAQVTPDS